MSVLFFPIVASYNRTMVLIPILIVFLFRNFSWMTRFLSNTLSGELTPEHEAIAKEVLRAKCLVGMLCDKSETMRRLNIIFNTKSDVRDRRREEECQEKLLFWDWPGKNRHEPVVQGSEAWNILYKHNTFDLRLFDYAQQLFEAQAKLFQDTPSSLQQQHLYIN